MSSTYFHCQDGLLNNNHFSHNNCLILNKWLKTCLIKGLQINNNGCEIVPFTKDYGHKLFLMTTMVLMFLLIDRDLSVLPDYHVFIFIQIVMVLMVLPITMVLCSSYSSWSWCSSWLFCSCVLINHHSLSVSFDQCALIFLWIIVVLCFIVLLILFIFYFAWGFFYSICFQCT